MTKEVKSTLRCASRTLMETSLEDKQHRESFERSLNTFLSEQNDSFDQIADRISKVEAEIAVVREITSSYIAYCRFQAGQNHADRDGLTRSNEAYPRLQARQNPYAFYNEITVVPVMIADDEFDTPSLR